MCVQLFDLKEKRKRERERDREREREKERKREREKERKREPARRTHLSKNGHTTTGNRKGGTEIFVDGSTHVQKAASLDAHASRLGFWFCLPLNIQPNMIAHSEYCKPLFVHAHGLQPAL